MRPVEETDAANALDVDTIRAILEAHPVCLGILFGSHASGTTHSASDVDVAVAFENRRPSDSDYNDEFFGLSADLSDALGTDDVDLVDLQTATPALAEAIFDHGVLLVGDPADADRLRRQLSSDNDASESPRDRLDAALDRIEAHLGRDGTAVPATGESDRDG